MTLLRRMPRGLYSTHDVIQGSGGTIPIVPPCGDIWIEGYKQTGSIGSLTKSTYRGVTITELATEVNFSEVFGECWVNSAYMYLTFASSVKISKIIVFGTVDKYTYEIPTSNFGSTSWNVIQGSGGTAGWDSPLSMLIYY